jgi:predicted HTH transcriptional regulator
LNFTQWVIETKTILEVSISKGTRIPYMAPDENGKWQAYVRVKDQNLKASDVMVKVWQRAKHKRNSAIT